MTQAQQCLLLLYTTSLQWNSYPTAKLGFLLRLIRTMPTMKYCTQGLKVPFTQEVCTERIQKCSVETEEESLFFILTFFDSFCSSPSYQVASSSHCHQFLCCPVGCHLFWSPFCRTWTVRMQTDTIYTNSMTRQAILTATNHTTYY